MQKVTAKALYAAAGGSGLFSATRMLRSFDEDDEDLARLQAEMARGAAASHHHHHQQQHHHQQFEFEDTGDFGAPPHHTQSSSSGYQNHQHYGGSRSMGGDDYDTTAAAASAAAADEQAADSVPQPIRTATQRYFNIDSAAVGADGTPSAQLSALERRRNRSRGRFQQQNQQMRDQQEKSKQEQEAKIIEPTVASEDYYGSSSVLASFHQRSSGGGSSGHSSDQQKPPAGGEAAKNKNANETVVDQMATASTSLGDSHTVAEAMRVIEDLWIGHEPAELAALYGRDLSTSSAANNRAGGGEGEDGEGGTASEWASAEEDAAAADEALRGGGSSEGKNRGGVKSTTSKLPSALTADETHFLADRFSDLPAQDADLLTDFIGTKPAASIKETLQYLDRCKSAADVETVYKKHICALPLWSDPLNGHGTRVVIMGKMTEVVARTFCVDQWLEIAAHARRFGFQLSRLHVNEVLTAIRIDLSAMFHQHGRTPELVVRTLERMQVLIHFSKEDRIRWEGVFLARLCLICTVIVSFMDRQNYYRGSFPADFHRREGLVGDWVISHTRALDYDETVRTVNRFIRDHGLDDHRHALKIRPAFTTAYRLIDYFFASDNLTQLIATVEASMGQGVNIAESTIAKMMQLCVSFNHPRAIELFRKYRLRMPEAVIATPDVSRLMTFYCRSGGGLPCPCCGEKYNHRNVELAVWDATPAHQRRCPLLQMARDQRGELEELARNDSARFGGGSGSGTVVRGGALVNVEDLAGGLSAFTASLANNENSSDAALQDKLLAAEMEMDTATLERLLRKKMADTAAAAGGINKSNGAASSSGGASTSSASPIPISPTNVFVDLPQCRDWSHIAFSLFDYSQQNNLLWSITEWRLFLQCCTYLREPEEIEAIAARDVRRARAMRAAELDVVPERRWASVDPPAAAANERLPSHLSNSAALAADSASSTTTAAGAGAVGGATSVPSFMASKNSSASILHNPCGTADETAAYLATYANATVGVKTSFARRHGLIEGGDASTSAEAAEDDGRLPGESELDMVIRKSLSGGGGGDFAADEASDPIVTVPFLKLSRAAKFDLANTIFKTNINFKTQVDDFVQRLYMRFLRCNNPQEVNTRARIWFADGVGTGRGSSGGEITPIASEEVMIAAFSINNESVNKMVSVGGGTRPLSLTPAQERVSNPTPQSLEMAAVCPRTGAPLSKKDGRVKPPPLVVTNVATAATPPNNSTASTTTTVAAYSSLAVSVMRAEASAFACDRVLSQDLFVTAFAKRRSRHELFRGGFLIKVHRDDVPKDMMDAYYNRHKRQRHSQLAHHDRDRDRNGQQQHHHQQNGVDLHEDLRRVVLPPIDISRYSDDRDEAERDYFYVFNPLAFGAVPLVAAADPSSAVRRYSPEGIDFRFTAARSIMAPAAQTAFAHIIGAAASVPNSAETASREARAEAEANVQMLRRFAYLIRKRPRNHNARATFKDSGSDISPGFNKKNWYLVPRD